jgi:hypothetical protein
LTHIDRFHCMVPLTQQKIISTTKHVFTLSAFLYAVSFRMAKGQCCVALVACCHYQHAGGKRDGLEVSPFYAKNLQYNAQMISSNSHHWTKNRKSPFQYVPVIIVLIVVEAVALLNPHNVILSQGVAIYTTDLYAQTQILVQILTGQYKSRSQSSPYIVHCWM